MGNNLITRLSDLKVLSSLVNLRNLNLQGNPIAENEKLAKKIKKLVPNLQIYNARPVDKTMKSEMGGRVDDSSLNVGNKPVVQKGEQTDHSMENKGSKHRVLSQSKDGHLADNAGDLDMKKDLKLKKPKREELLKEKASDPEENSTTIENKVRKKLKTVQENEYNVIDYGETRFIDPDSQKEVKCKKQKRNELSKEERASEEFGKKSKKVKQNVVSVTDDGGTPFMDFFAGDENAENSGEKMGDKTVRDVDMIGGLATFPIKREKIKSRGTDSGALTVLTQATEVGLGGQSTWDDS